MIKRSFFSLIVMLLVAMEAYAIPPLEDVFSFIITVKTDNNGTSSNTQFTIPTTGGGYNYNVDCTADGEFEVEAQTGDYTCNYATSGTYTIRIISNTDDAKGFPRIYFNDTGDKDKILTIEQWGVAEWTSMANAFRGCRNLDLKATDVPDLSHVTSLNNIFSKNSSLVASGANLNWDTSNITDMGYMFYSAYQFNQNIGSWDTSHVANMYAMFYNANAFNQDIGDWNTSSVENMEWMFGHNNGFNQDISDWNTSSVKNMSLMFYNANQFNQNLSSWNIENVTTFEEMFGHVTLDTRNYDAILISWNAQNVKSGVNFHAGNSHYCYAGMERAHLVSADDWNITDAGLDCTDTEDFVITVKTDNNGTSTDTQFTIPTHGGGYNYNVDCDNDGTNEATAQTGDYTCNYATSGTYTIRIKDNKGDDTGFPRIYFNNQGDKEKIIDINQWGTGKWHSMEYAFYGCPHLDLHANDVPNLTQATSLSSIFLDASYLLGEYANFDWDTSNITDMSQMFSGATYFNQDIGDWNTSHVTVMSSMFTNAETFNQDISDWNTSAVTSMYQMFTNATSFNQDISGWDTSNVTKMWKMFSNATSFNQNLENWNVSSLEQAKYMLNNSGLSTANYDALLIGWNAQNLKSDVNLSAGGIHYCNGESARANMIASDGWNITDGGKVCIPDYRPKLTTHGLYVNGANGNVDILITIAEGLNGDTEGDLKFIIRKNVNLELNFDSTKTLQQGKVVENSLWELTETSALYIFKYIGNGGLFSPASISRLGFDADFTSPPSSKGKFDLLIQILDNSGGDSNNDNNKDMDTIRYNNL